MRHLICRWAYTLAPMRARSQTMKRPPTVDMPDGEKQPLPCPLGSNRLYVVGGTSCLHARMQMVITWSAMTQSALYTVRAG